MSEEIIQPTEGGQKAAQEALEAIKDRSFSGRHPELGKMIKCQVCGLRHRENERKCVQRFATQKKRGEGPLQGELVPPEGLTQLTARQVFGARMFNKRRRAARRRPVKPLTKWQKILKEKYEKVETTLP